MGGGGQQPIHYIPTEVDIDEALMILFPVQKPDKPFDLSFITSPHIINILSNIRAKGVFKST